MMPKLTSKMNKRPNLVANIAFQSERFYSSMLHCPTVPFELYDAVLNYLADVSALGKQNDLLIRASLSVAIPRFKE
jgi:hypothetical protein